MRGAYRREHEWRARCQDRDLLHELVALQADEMAETGAGVTVASYVRGLIRHEARLKGLLEPRRKRA